MAGPISGRQWRAPQPQPGYEIGDRRVVPPHVGASANRGSAPDAGERNIPADLHRYRNWSGNQIENRYSHWIWRQYASAFWDDVRLDRVLPFREARDEEDEKHVHPLQLDVIERAVKEEPVEPARSRAMDMQQVATMIDEMMSMDDPAKIKQMLGKMQAMLSQSSAVSDAARHQLFSMRLRQSFKI